LGALDLVRSVTALAPAGFWTASQRRYAITLLSAHRRTAGLPGPLLRRLAGSDRLRRQSLRFLYGRPERVTTDVFLADSWSLSRCVAFEPTAVFGLHYECFAQPVVPTAIAWGDRDRILPPSQGKTAMTRLPRAEHVEMPGCGHIPMTDDPERVAAVIKHTTRMKV
ncbi:MAG: alpha/beta hydrolase, partial [Nocardioidaceae bacterium]